MTNNSSWPTLNDHDDLLRVEYDFGKGRARWAIVTTTNGQRIFGLLSAREDDPMTGIIKYPYGFAHQVMPGPNGHTLVPMYKLLPIDFFTGSMELHVSMAHFYYFSQLSSVDQKIVISLLPEANDLRAQMSSIHANGPVDPDSIARANSRGGRIVMPK